MSPTLFNEVLAWGVDPRCQSPAAAVTEGVGFTLWNLKEELLSERHRTKKHILMAKRYPQGNPWVAFTSGVFFSRTVTILRCTSLKLPWPFPTKHTPRHDSLVELDVPPCMRMWGAMGRVLIHSHPHRFTSQGISVSPSLEPSSWGTLQRVHSISYNFFYITD